MYFIIKAVYEKDLIDGLDTLKEFAKRIKKNPEVAHKELEDALREFAEEKGFCPSCITGEMEETDSFKEDMGEMHGHPSYQKTIVFICLECGYQQTI